MRYAVMVVGGGPAGAATARALRRIAPSLADRTLLLERAKTRRTKLCGGGLTGACLAEMARLGLELRVPHVVINKAVFQYQNITKAYDFTHPSAVVRRDVFDDDLLSQVSSDVEVHRGERVESIHRGDAPDLIVKTDRRFYRARLVVGADGVGSKVRRFLYAERGLPRDPVTRLWQADVPVPQFRPEHADAMVFDFTAMDEGLNGYFWTFPSLVTSASATLGATATLAATAALSEPVMNTGRVMNTGLMHLPPYGSLKAKQVLQDHLARYDYDSAVPVHAHPELAYSPTRAIGGRNLALVGDAAGIEPLAGEGLAQCFAYGRHLAHFAKRQFAAGGTDYTRFRRLLTKTDVGREMNTARRVAKRLYGPQRGLWLDLFLNDPKIGALLSKQVQGLDALHHHYPSLVMRYLRGVVRSWGASPR